MFEYNGRRYATYAAALAVYNFGRYLKNNHVESPSGRITERIKQFDPESYTITKTKKKKPKTEEMENSVAGIKTGFLKFNANRPLKRTQKNSIEYRDYYNYELIWLGTSKNFYPVCAIGTRSQYMNDADTAQNLGPLSNRNWFSLSAEQGQPGGSFMPINANPPSDWIGCSSMTVHMDFINLSTLPFTMKVTWYKSLKNQNESPLQVYSQDELANQLYTATLQTNPAIVIEPTLAGNENNLGYIAATVNQIENLTTMPYINLHGKRIKSSWAVLKSKTVTMAGGDIYKLTNAANVNVFQKLQVIKETEEYPAGCVMCVLETQGLASHIVLANIPPQPAQNEPVLAPGRLGVVISRKLNLKSLTNRTEKYNLSYVGRGTVAIRGTVGDMSTVQSSDIAVALGTQTA